MIDARRAIEAMSDAVFRYLSNLEKPAAELTDLRLLEASVIAKLHMAEHNAALLSSASLEQLSRLENPLVDSSEAVTLISDTHWDITIKSRKAGTLVRLMAFSEAVSACVNVADTLGRYLRKAYGIRLKERQANLMLVRQELDPRSSLLHILECDPGLGWMEKLRDLRGECQHGKLAGMIYTAPGTNTEPLVPCRYCEGDDMLPISAYIEWAMAKTAELMAKSAHAIAADPEHAVQLKS
jgi:hypothetical protein